MQACTECKNKFSWIEIFKSLLLGNQPIICKQCGATFRISSKSKYIEVYFILGLALILKLLHFELSTIILFLLIGALLFLAIFPFFVKYTYTKKNK